MNVKDVLLDSRNFGRHQKLQFLYLSLANILTPLHMIASVFIAANVKSRCAVDEIANLTYSLDDDTLAQYYPLNEKGRYDTCKIITDNNTSSSCIQYVYDRTQYVETIVSQYDLVCDRVPFTTAAGVVYMGGLLAGSLIFGYISDWLGRKTTVIIAIWLQGLLAVAVMFSPSVEVFMVLRFFLGAVSVGALIAAFVLMLEICPESWRPISAICQTMGWCVGVMVLSFLAYFIRDWRYLQLSFACLSVPYMLSYWWLIEESPSWLIAKGHRRRAMQVMERMKKANQLSSLDLEGLKDDIKSEESEKERSALKEWIMVFKSPVLLLNFLINCFGWFTASMGYYGLALNVGNLVGDVYINNFIGGLVEVPAYLLLFATMKVGRKWPYVGMMLIGGVALIASAFLLVYLKDERYSALIVAINMIGKFMVSAAFELIYFWCAEMYPTNMRNTMVGLNSMSARIGGILSPVIANIPTYTDTEFSKGIPPLVFGVFMVVGGCLAILKPETNKMPLPETVSQANKMTMNWKYSGNRADSSDGNMAELSKLDEKQ